VQKALHNDLTFFALLGSACVKALRKHVGEIDPGLNFINVLGAAFMSADPKSAKRQSSC